MPAIDIALTSLSDLKPSGSDTLVILAGEDLALSSATGALVAPLAATLRTAATTAKFKGKMASAMELLAPAGVGAGRLVVAGATPARKARRLSITRLWAGRSWAGSAARPAR